MHELGVIEEPGGSAARTSFSQQVDRRIFSAASRVSKSIKVLTLSAIPGSVNTIPGRDESRLCILG